MKDHLILRDLRELLDVSYEDIPKTLLRFKNEIEQMKKEMNEDSEGQS